MVFHLQWLQWELAIEERFRTTSFPFRLMTTVIVGFSIASTYNLWQYHKKEHACDSFRDFVEEVAYDGMMNTYDEDHAPPGEQPNVPRPTGSGTGQSASPAFCPAYEYFKRTDDPCAHVCVPISNFKGWNGAKRPRCGECNEPTSYCCSVCSIQTIVWSLCTWLRPSTRAQQQPRCACATIRRIRRRARDAPRPRRNRRPQLGAVSVVGADFD